MKESIGLPDAELHAKSFEKKINLTKIKYSRNSPDLENTRCGHQQPYNFFSVFASFCQTLPGNLGKQKSVDSKQKNWLQLVKKNCFFWLSQKESFLEPIEKNPSIFNYWWAGMSNYSTFLGITKIYIFLLLYFTLVLLLIMLSHTGTLH